jgi:leucyl aminopeptidase
MSALVVALAVLSGLAGSAPGPDVWITIDRDVLVAFERGGEAWETTPTEIGDLAAPRGVVIATAMPEARIDALASFIHERYRRCGGFVAHESREKALAAAERAVHSETLERMPPPIAYTIDNGPVVRAVIGEMRELNIRNNIISLSNFFTRRHNCPTGLQSAQWIRDQWVAAAQGRPDVTVELYSHPTTPQPSVILTIPGTTLPSEVVVIGGHQDSTRSLPQGVPYDCQVHLAPGADDDASGIATLTEVLRAALALGYQPQRTVKFMAYAAEEVGLRGSDHIAAQYLAQGVNVVGVLQFDMTNYSDTPRRDIVMYTDFTNAAQNAFVSQLANAYVPAMGVATPRVTSQCGYGCSDHASWHDRGFPASFPFEAVFGDHSPFIHTSNDTLAQSGNHALRSVPFAKLGAAYMAEIAKGGFTARGARKAGR